MSEFQQAYQELVTSHHISKPTANANAKPNKPNKPSKPNKPPTLVTPPLAPPTLVSPLVGVKRALLIGINYFGQSGELNGCQNDVDNMQAHLKKCGFTEFTILKDVATDREHKLPTSPTRDNILAAIKTFVSNANIKAGDILYVHYSGHGSSLKCVDGKEEDGKDECICPVDYSFKKDDSGFIRDNALNALLVQPLPAGVKLRVCFDSCHSGSALDLPYMWTSNTKELRELRAKSRSPSDTTNSNKDISHDIVFISGCRDEQTSADSFFNHQSQGAMTWSMLEALQKLPSNGTWEDLVTLMRSILQTKKYDQVPQLSVVEPKQLKNTVDLK